GGVRQISSHRSARKVGMVDYVEHLTPQLEPHPLSKPPDLADRCVPIREARPAQNIAAHVAERVEGVWKNRYTVLEVAPACVVESVQQSLRGRYCRAMWVAASHVFVVIIRIREKWDRCLS